ESQVDLSPIGSVKQRDGARSPRCSAASRPVAYRECCGGVSCRCAIAETAVRSNGVVVIFPERQNLTGIGERAEQRFVQQLIAQPAIEAFDESILLRLAGRNV